VNGSYQSEGILEVYLFNQWYTICGKSISEGAVTAVCHQLGYTTGDGADLIQYVCTNYKHASMHG